MPVWALIMLDVVLVAVILAVFAVIWLVLRGVEQL
ncbi:MAG: hypothetical protein QOF52_1235 [Propionibacteriaceae bacterium]|jgi:hypothetical protein|nr:hypothetical protein [Propionibacteriaceae bacterium]MDX6321377.1 hypothetical protein [Propionibacteriaceae bacterium]